MRRLVFRRTISHKYNKQILICCLSLRISSTMPLLHTCQLFRFPGSFLVGPQISQSPTLRAQSLSIFIDKSGRGKKTAHGLHVSYRACVDSEYCIRCQSRVTSGHKTKTNGRDIFETNKTNVRNSTVYFCE